jgi:hypothetical protein
VIFQNDNGIRGPVDDTQALREVIVQLSQNSSLQTKLGQNARETILQKHGFEAWQQDLTGFYVSLLHQTNTGKTKAVEPIVKLEDDH